MAEYANGFVYGIVTDVEDPDRLGRVRAQIPGYYDQEHPEWIMPAGWPGAGELSRGSRYPASVGQQIAVFFELGDMDAPPIFFPLAYGFDPDLEAPGGPQSAVGEGVDPNDRAVLWEDNQMAVFIVDKENDDATQRDKRIVMLDKRTGSNITLNATDGAGGKSVSISIEANTSLSLKSNGIIDIDAPVVQIKKRRVMSGPGPGLKSI